MVALATPMTPVACAPTEEPARVAIEVEGAVQGVGFRPWAYRMAVEGGLTGFVRNHSGGVRIEVEGAVAAVEHFVARLNAEAPPLARIHSLHSSPIAPLGSLTFEIVASAGGSVTALLLPDIATCPDCLDDIHRPNSSRTAYPFTNCTHCGPRFSIVQRLPYDRAATTMAGFALCPQCAREYADPTDRRFHAQPTACAECGPSLALLAWHGGWRSVAAGKDALVQAAQAILGGQIVAVKGLGGFHLVVDGTNDDAVERLRLRKGREEKPLAILVRTIEDAHSLVTLSEEEATLLTSAAAPIVLAERRAGATVARAVAPDNRRLGVMLAATPLHHLLLEQVARPVVATSGNHSDEPLCFEDDDALARLGNPDAPLADLFLVHNRPIARHVDDSVVHWIAGAPQFVRRARGYAPLPIVLRETPDDAPTVLAVGGHQKNTIALAHGAHVFVSQHIGDLDTLEARAVHERVMVDFLTLYETSPAAIAHDAHTDYASTLWARHAAAVGAPNIQPGMPLLSVQHHHAHLVSCLADNGVDEPALGVIWDGSGAGPDGTIWGGEFLFGDAGAFVRAAHLRTFALPGGEAAVREPWRPALALLHEIGGSSLVEQAGRDLVPEASRRFIRSLLESAAGQGAASGVPRTSSAGRFFDGCAALLGLRTRAGYEGQAATLLEQYADPGESGAYSFSLCESSRSPLQVDWEPAILSLQRDHAAGVGVPQIAARIHNGLAAAIVATVRRLSDKYAFSQVALSGGCFQNRLLSERTSEQLRAAGYAVLLHRQVPPNDGGLALGQALVARAALARTCDG